VRNGFAAVIVGLASAALFAVPLGREARPGHTSGLAHRKSEGDPAAIGPPAPLLATLVQTHTDERVPLDFDSPATGRFDALLADRVTGAVQALDPRLLGLLRTMASRLSTRDGSPRIELVSGFRSPKLNEMLRKKGHHVASHSQHSLGHAVDFRLVVPCTVDAGPVDRCDADGGADMGAIDPRTIEAAIRASGWDGGVGVYTATDDWFVHADVGPHRSWFEGPGAARNAALGSN
jgi:uncharacterized protein YcbK (DUF882 family)